MRSQQGDLSRELVFPPANSITTKHKEDENWHNADANGSSSSTPPVVSQVPQLQPTQPPALCRALYDFKPEEINADDSKYCLSFLKVWLSNCWSSITFLLLKHYCVSYSSVNAQQALSQRSPHLWFSHDLETPNVHCIAKRICTPALTRKWIQFLIHRFQHDVVPPFAAVLTLLGRLSTRFVCSRVQWCRALHHCIWRFETHHMKLSLFLS